MLRCVESDPGRARADAFSRPVFLDDLAPRYTRFAGAGAAVHKKTPPPSARDRNLPGSPAVAPPDGDIGRVSARIDWVQVQLTSGGSASRDSWPGPFAGSWRALCAGSARVGCFQAGTLRDPPYGSRREAGPSLAHSYRVGRVPRADRLGDSERWLHRLGMGRAGPALLAAGTTCVFDVIAAQTRTWPRPAPGAASVAALC